IIDAKDRNLWRVYLLHFSGEKVLSHHARRNKTCTRAARPARAARPDHLRRPGVIGVLFPANKYAVSQLEVSELRGSRPLRYSVFSPNFTVTVAPSARVMSMESARI